MKRATRITLAALIAASITLVPACTSNPDATRSTSADAPQESVAPADIAQMSPAEKREALGSDFPLEVPVPKGAVREASSQGTNVFVYKIGVDAPVDAVAAWYRQAYAVRDWVEGQSSGSADAVRLVFSKAAAQSEVRLTGTPTGTEAVVSVGIGVPVGDTY